MSYRLDRDETVAQGVRRIGLEQIARAHGEMDDRKLDRHETIHQLRKRMKKLRALLRLVRGGALDESSFAEENTRYRDAAREISEFRDARVLVETYDALLEKWGENIDRRAFGQVRRALTRRPEHQAANMADLGQIESALTAGRDRLEALEFKQDGFEALEPGLSKTYRRARKAMKKVRKKPKVEHMHTWRKRVKNHRHHMRLLHHIWPGPLKARAEELKALSDLLGEDHDLADFSETLIREGMPGATGQTAPMLLVMVEDRRTELQAAAIELGQRIFAEKTPAHTARLRSYWQSWQGEARREPHKSAETEVA